MRITIVSKSWPSGERSGVSLVANLHAEILDAAGHVVTIIGGEANVNKMSRNANSVFYVPSRGSGVWYSPSRINRDLLMDVITRSAPDLVVVEAWQTAISHATIDVAYQLSIPILMISHGVSVHAFTTKFIDVLRGLSWWFYSRRTLPKLISRLSAITALDVLSVSKRFYDRDLARNSKIPVISLVNSPINFTETVRTFHERNKQILCVGYFSPIKNQLDAIKVFAGLPESFKLRFIGLRTGSYYRKCLSKIEALNLQARITFTQDDECNIAEEMSKSLVVLCVSITEVLPVTLLEAMASGTPFVAPPVGAIPSLRAGLIANNTFEQQAAILSLAENIEHWNRASEIGRATYLEQYTRNHVRSNLLKAISIATNRKGFI